MEEIFKAKTERPNIAIPNAKHNLKCGLKHYIGKFYKWLENYSQVAEWMKDNEGKSLLIYGTNGTGKTIIAQKILPDLIDYYNRIKPYICNAIDLSRINDNKLDYMQMRCAKVIVIDDIGVESIASNYGEKRDLLSEFIDIAEKDDKIMILTTNLSKLDLAQKYGDRTIDRLRPYKHIQLSDYSLRK